MTLCKFLSCNDLVIQTSAATLLPKLFKMKNYKIDIISGNLNNILNIYFKLLNELDLDHLIFCLEKFIDEFQEQIFVFSNNLAEELISTFKKVVIRDEDNLITDDEERVASRILRTLAKLISLTNKYGKNKYQELQDICIPLINWNFQNVIPCIFSDNIFLLSEILHSEHELSKNIWMFFDELLKSLLEEGNLFYFFLH